MAIPGRCPASCGPIIAATAGGFLQSIPHGPANLAAYRDTNVPNARKAYEIQLEMYKQRRVAWPEVMKLTHNLLQVRSEFTESLLELRRAEIAITGLLMVDGLTPPMPPVPGGHLETTPKPR